MTVFCSLVIAAWSTALRAYQIPAASRTSRGVPIVQMLPIPRDEKITSVVPVSEFYCIFEYDADEGGYIKKTELAAFSNIRANGLIAISWKRATSSDGCDAPGLKYIALSLLVMAWQFTLELTMSNCVPWVEPHVGG